MLFQQFELAIGTVLGCFCPLAYLARLNLFFYIIDYVFPVVITFQQVQRFYYTKVAAVWVILVDFEDLLSQGCISRDIDLLFVTYECPVLL